MRNLKSFKTQNLLFIAALSLSMLSCGGNDETESDLNCLESVNKARDLVTAKSIKYSGNSSKENCKEYENAIKEALSKIENCSNYPARETLKEGYKLNLQQLDCD